MNKFEELFNIVVVSIAKPFLKLLGLHKDADLFQNDLWNKMTNTGEVLLISRYVLSCIFMMLSVVFLILSATYDLSFSTCDESYFQRAGAILVIAALTVEFTRNTITNQTNSEKIHSIYILDASLIKRDSIVRRLGWIIAILGTIIWAYGDLLISGSCP